MLAATSSKSDTTLDAIRLVLMLEANRKKYPETLKKYFDAVVSQTVDLLSDPARGAAEASPEAVSLAFRMASDSRLRQVIEGIAKLKYVSSDQAALALEGLEAALESDRESSHFRAAVSSAL